MIKSKDDLPLVLTPMEVAAILGVSKNTAYEVVHSKGFPAIRVGRQYRIPRDKFLHWLEVVQVVEVV